VSYDVNDPRSQLAATATMSPRATAADVAAAPEYFELASCAPDEVTDAGTTSWIVRTQTACIVYSDAVAGDVLSRDEQVDEYVVVLVSVPSRPAAVVEITGADRSEVVDEDAVCVVPSGRSEVRVVTSGVVVRIFSVRATDLLAKARNAAAHAEAHPHAAPFQPWPPAPDGERLRVYRLAHARVDPQRFGQIYRCSTVMVNVIPADPGARNPARMSPHHHDDFEQVSLQIDGDYVHHIRTPWTTNLSNWRDDEHRACASPAIVVIPPPTVHTSQGVGDHRHQLIDIFCPPRRDFSAKPGWVLNHEDYPNSAD
jgi:hypothetical protein